MNAIILCLCLMIAVPAGAFLPTRLNAASIFSGRTVLNMATQVKEKVATANAPDFYWEFRLNRLIKKKGNEFPFVAKNYEATTAEQRYYSYYLDLNLNGKIGADFDKEAESTLSEDELLSLYGSICDWTKEVDDKSTNPTNLPESDFDLVAQIYPEVSLKEFKAPFDELEVGPNFPYKNMQDMIEATIKGTYKPIPRAFNSIEDAQKELQSLKAKSMKALEEIYADVDAYAQNSFLDDKAKEHYSELKTKLSKLPQTAQQWSEYKTNMDKQIDEMARLASKKVDPHHHHDHDDHHAELSPAEEFKKKYGRDLSEMAERTARYLSDPAGYMEKVIKDKFGPKGVDMWKDTEEIGAKLSVLSASDKAKIEADYKKFLSHVGDQ